MTRHSIYHFFPFSFLFSFFYSFNSISYQRANFSPHKSSYIHLCIQIYMHTFILRKLSFRTLTLFSVVHLISNQIRLEKKLYFNKTQKRELGISLWYILQLVWCPAPRYVWLSHISISPRSCQVIFEMIRCKIVIWLKILLKVSSLVYQKNSISCR